MTEPAPESRFDALWSAFNMNVCSYHWETGDCAFCIREWWHWLKHRQAAMDVRRKRPKKAREQSFDDAMRTSNVLGREPNYTLEDGDVLEVVDEVIYIKLARR